MATSVDKYRVVIKFLITEKKNSTDVYKLFMVTLVKLSIKPLQIDRQGHFKGFG